MTPSAMTAAGRTAATPRPAQAPRPGHRRTARPQAPRGPRRVSGPARPRRVSVPAAAGHRPSLAARGLLVIRGLPEHTLLDRIVRGRAWIPLLGVLLVGIVAMQVEILKLGAGMGRWIERSSTLSTRNQALQASVAGLMDDQRIERLAAKMGMVMTDPTAVSFLSAQPGGGAARAVANIHAPDSSIFTAQSASQLAAAAALSSTTSAPTQLGGATSSTGASSGAGASSATSPTVSSSPSAGAASSQPAATGTTPSATTGSGQPVDSAGSGSSGSSGQPTGSGGAASIAPPSSQSSAANGG
jgi:hypothetical protein